MRTTDARRSCVRSAFRRLDSEREGFVAWDMLRARYNTSRHPHAVMNIATPDQLLDEFDTTFKMFLRFRRGERVTTVGRVSWEEFEE